MADVTRTRRRMWLWLISLFALPRLAAGGQGPVKIPPSTTPPKPVGAFLPFEGSTNASGRAAFQVTNGASSLASTGVQGTGRWGVIGMGQTMGVGGSATGADSAGVDGRAFNGGTAVVGIYATSGGGSTPSFGPIGGGNTKEGITRGFLGTEKHGVEGESDVDGGRGVVGRADKGTAIGVLGESQSNVGVQGQGRDGKTRGMLGTTTMGVQGESDVAGGHGVAGKTTGGKDAAAIYGQSVDGFAGFFRGRVTITDHLLAKTLYVESITASKGMIGSGAAKLFKIDHPLDPASKFLSHASIESNEVKNLYDGIATLDDNGAATIVLPDWFDALNKDFRYQLTCLGRHAPVYIANEIQSGRFEIAGGIPGMKVAWQVTGVRKDVFARAHPLKVEEEKGVAERGKYLNPVEHGFPETFGIHYANTDAVASFDAQRLSTVRT